MNSRARSGRSRASCSLPQLRSPSPRSLAAGTAGAALERRLSQLECLADSQSRELRIQFERIAQLEAELDFLRKRQRRPLVSHSSKSRSRRVPPPTGRPASTAPSRATGVGAMTVPMMRARRSGAHTSQGQLEGRTHKNRRIVQEAYVKPAMNSLSNVSIRNADILAFIKVA